MCKVFLNEEKNGIELTFEQKPAAETLTLIKQTGFRWNRNRRIWWAKRNDETIALANTLVDGEISKRKEEDMNAKIYDLWEMTRTDDIEKHERNRLSTKEIAAIIRKNVRARFPMCKFSVRTTGYSSIDIDLIKAPFEKDSDELNAIAHYVYKFADSYNYCTCYDPYGDYGSSYHFYGVYEHGIVSYKYEQTEADEQTEEIKQLFAEKKMEWEKAEEERREKEYQEYLVQKAKEEEEYKKREEIRKENHKKIEANAEVADVDFTVLDLVESGSKNDNLDEYLKSISENPEYSKRTVAEVKKAVYFNRETYDLFVNALLDDYTFISGGGTATRDNRVNSMMDYNRMSPDEREAVEWICVDCTAIYCNDELKFVIDPEGHNYARYCLLVDENTKIEEYECKQIVSDEEMKKFKHAAEILEDVSFEVITENNIGNIGNASAEVQECYKKLMKERIIADGLMLNERVIQSIDGEFKTFKRLMYDVLEDMENVQEQFKMANLHKGQKVTVCEIDGFSGFSIHKVTVDSVEYGKYAQYDKAVAFRYVPEGKRKICGHWIYKDVVIYDGWFDVPESLFYDVKIGNGYVSKHSKYMSFDRKQYDVVMEYMKNLGNYPIINSYKTQY